MSSGVSQPVEKKTKHFVVGTSVTFARWLQGEQGGKGVVFYGILP